MSIYDNTFTKDGVKLPYMTGVEYDKRKKDAVDGVTDVTAPTLGAAGQAGLVKANAINREVAKEETSAFQLDKILGSDSALMKRAESQGLQRGAGRGLLNSSIAVEAAQGAMIDRAQPFALNDASTYLNTAESNMRASNQAELSNAQTGTEVNVFNTGQKNTFATTQAGLDAQASIANAASANSALSSFLDKENSGFLQQNQQTFTAGENLADRTLRETLQEGSITAAASEGLLNRTANSSEAALSRAANVTLQDDAQLFSTSENALSRTAAAFESALNRANATANTDKTIAANMTISSNNAIAVILSNPDTTPAQKENQIKDVRNTNLESIELIERITNSSNTTGAADPEDTTATETAETAETADTADTADAEDIAVTAAAAAEVALTGVSAEGGFSEAETNQVYDAIDTGAATVLQVAKALDVSPDYVSTNFEQIKKDRAAAAVEAALRGVSAEGGFSQGEINQVYDAIDTGTVTISDVARILGLPPGDVSAAFDQIKNERTAAAINTGLLNSFEDYDLYDRRYGGGEEQRV